MNETYQHPGKWHDITLLPTLMRSSENHFTMSYVIRGLERNSVYEAIVQAKNTYGWNEVSINFIHSHFNFNCFDGPSQTMKFHLDYKFKLSSINEIK